MFGWLRGTTAIDSQRGTLHDSRSPATEYFSHSREVTLDLDLPSHLLLDAVLDEFLLVQALERDDVLRLNERACHVDASELALAEGFANLERGEGEGLRGAVAAVRNNEVSTPLLEQESYTAPLNGSHLRIAPVSVQPTYGPAALESIANTLTASPLIAWPPPAPSLSVSLRCSSRSKPPS